jgi:hypothetical protein
MMKITRILFAGAALAVAGSAQSVSFNYDTDADFSSFKTYKWVAIPGAAKLDDLTARQLTAALDAELARKGLIKTDNNADLNIGYQVATTQQTQINAYLAGWQFGFGHLRRKSKAAGVAWRGYQDHRRRSQAGKA